MKYCELNHIWKRIFESEWESVCHKSKAIAAVIVDENGEIISEGRNKTGEVIIPNPRVNHAEVEAVRNLDIKTISFDANGDVLNGNVYETDILEIIRTYRP